MALESTQLLTEVSGIFPGGKGGRCVGLTTKRTHVPIVLKSGSLNLLEPSGPVQACTGITLRLPLPLPPDMLYTCRVRVMFQLRVWVAGKIVPIHAINP